MKCGEQDESTQTALVRISSSPSRSASTPAPPSTSCKPGNQQAANRCTGGPKCALWGCCPAIRAIGIFEGLRAFDELFSAEAGFRDGKKASGDGAARQAYLRMVAGKADKGMRKFEEGFGRALKVVGSWLQVPAEPTARFEGEGEGEGEGAGRRGSVVGEAEADGDTLLVHVARLFLSTHLLEVVHCFLGVRNVKDWMTRAETYLDALEVVKRLMDCGLGFLLKEVSGPGVGVAASSGYFNAFAVAPVQSLPVVPLVLSTTVGTGTSVTLYELVSQLESFRGELKRFLSKVSFGVTVEKANKLHEAITYLVLELVVGEF